METTFDYLRAYATLLGSRILETYPPLQSTKDPVAPPIASLLRKALPAQALAITGTAKYLSRAKSARIVAECGAGKTYMALGTIHVLADGRPSTTLVMCPSHITYKWAREVLLTIPRARAFLIEDMRNGGDPSRPHGMCEVKLSKGKTAYEGNRFAEQVKERLCNYSAQDLKKHDLLRVTTAADAANIVAEMDGLLRERGTLSESTQCPTAEEIFTRMSAYMEAPAAA
jgi:N12 class adenine-specific DNA methylase